MLLFSEIIKEYPAKFQSFGRFIMREYLQYKILQIIFDSMYAKELAFMGGTALRLIYGNSRFSEDLDFDNFNMPIERFNQLSESIKKELGKEGYEVEMRTVHKGAYHCYIRFPELLYNEGLSGYKEEKILIQLDTEPQAYDFEPESIILNKFDVFTQIAVVPLPILLAQKFYAILNRKRNKGRDFFDVIFILSKIQSPDYSYLSQKLGISNAAELKARILEKCDQLDMAEMAKDVAVFLFEPKDVNKVKLFPSYIAQATL